MLQSIGRGARIERKLDQILAALTHERGCCMAGIVDSVTQLETELAAEQTVPDGVTTLINAFITEVEGLKANQTDPTLATRIDAVTSTLKSRAASIAAAIASVPAADLPPVSAPPATGGGTTSGA
jgi:hypothetical protein